MSVVICKFDLLACIKQASDLWRTCEKFPTYESFDNYLFCFLIRVWWTLVTRTCQVEWLLKPVAFFQQHLEIIKAVSPEKEYFHFE